MTFTIIIPAFNCEKSLATTVDSVRVAGLYDYEILLIDDGSTDGTAILCDRLSDECDGVRCIHQPNAGVSAARNRGIDEARGDYIWFVDADDTVEPDAMNHAVHIAAEEHPDMLIFGLSFDYYHRGQLYRQDALVPPCVGMLSPEQLRTDFRVYYDCNSLTSVCNKFFRRDLLIEQKIRFHEGLHLMEDFLFVLETLPHCNTIYCLPEAIYHYRQGEDERGAYRRLQKIPDLAAYIRPFETAIRQLNIPNEENLTDEFYSMLIWQKMQYSSLKDIRQTVKVHESGNRAGMALKLTPVRIYVHNRKTMLRHRLAVAVKSTGLYQRIKAATR